MPLTASATKEREMSSKELLDKVLAIIDSHKAEEVIAHDVSGFVSYADYVVICSGQSSRQVEALAMHITGELRKEGVAALGVEGRAEGEWVLIDFGDVIVHVFDEPVRAFYDLEGLWGEAPKVHVTPERQSVSYAAH